MDRLCGIAAAPGIAVGPAYVLDRRSAGLVKHHIRSDQVEAEIGRLREAVHDSDRQIQRIKAKLAESHGDEHHEILDAHQLILHDERMIGAAETKIRQDLINSEWALRRTVEGIKAFFEELEHDYFRERRSDIDFVGDRIMRNLLGHSDAPTLQPGSIVIAHDLGAADVALMWRTGAAGFVTDIGSVASHASIMARSLQLPAVVDVGGLSETCGSGDVVIVDGGSGEVLLNPARDLVATYEQQKQRLRQLEQVLLGQRDQPAKTRDGHRLTLCANIELPEEIEFALQHGAEGIGLFRTEFLYMNRVDLPSEQDHVEQTAAALQALGDRPAIFRVCDLGADKLATSTRIDREPNPALGLRGIRLLLRHRKMFQTQMRGILKAHAGNDARILLPMVSSIEEVRRGREVIEEARTSLLGEGIAVGSVEVGIMVETPSTVAMIDLFMHECDFFSIGTNDLVQYALAADRTSEHVSYLYDAKHPAIFRLINQVMEVCRSSGKRVSICGEMAGEPRAALALAGLGVNELSMNASAIPYVKQELRATSLADCKILAACVLNAKTTDDVISMLTPPEVSGGVDEA